MKFTVEALTIAFAITSLPVQFGATIAIFENEFFNDFLTLKNGFVIINSCWEKDKLIAIVKNLMSKHSVSIQLSNDIIKHLDSLKSLNQIYYISDLRHCPNSELVLDKFHQHKLFHYHQAIIYVLLLSADDLKRMSKNYYEHYFIPPSTEVIVSVINGSGNIDLWQPYKTHRNSKGLSYLFVHVTVWENYGNWTHETGLQENYKYTPKVRRRIDLKGAKLVAGCQFSKLESRKYYDEFREPYIDSTTKQYYQPLTYIMESLHSNYSLVNISVHDYFKNQSKKKFSSADRAEPSEIDITCGTLLVQDGVGVMEYIFTGNHFQFSFILKKPSLSFIKDIFYLPFAKDVWIIVLVTMLVFSLGLKLILTWELRHGKSPMPGVNSTLLSTYSASDAWLISLECVCQQGSMTEPASISGRVIFFIFLTSFMVLYVSYSANIVVFLQSTSTVTLRDLIDSRIDVGVHQTQYMKRILECGGNRLQRELYDRKMKNGPYLDIAAGMSMVRQGNFAFHTNSQEAYKYILKNFTNYDICQLQELPGFLQFDAGYLQIPKLSPYKDFFKVSALRAYENGVVTKTNTRIFLKPECYVQDVGSFKSVGFYDCYEVFYLFYFGIILSFTILLMEIITDKMIKRYQHRNLIKSNKFRWQLIKA